MNKHVKLAAGTCGYRPAGRIGGRDKAALRKAGYHMADNGLWYRPGYGPVRGGWGSAGLFGTGYGPCRNPIGQ